MTIRDKDLFLFCENNQNHLLSQLSKHKSKEKWSKKLWQAKLLVQILWVINLLETIH